MKLYLDNCCFNRPFDDQKNTPVRIETEAKLLVQSNISDGVHDLVWSYILEFENGQNPYRDRSATIFEWKNVAKERVVESDEVIARAEGFAAIGLKPKDALHVSCAIQAGAECFLTTDKGILNKKIDEIRLLNPVDFVREQEG